jgi:predicted site-specific integrase-resolvase
VAALSNLYPEAEVVSEIGGGLNFKGKKMLALLGQVLSGDVGMVVVAHPDRLARWGFDLFRWLCEQNRCSLMVLNETSLSREPEMVEDILAILDCFSSRLYGRSQYKTQVKEDPDLPQPRAKSSLA